MTDDNRTPSDAGASELTRARRAQFDEQGVLLVSGLIPPETVAGAVESLAAAMRENPGAAIIRTTAANACYTERLCAVARALAGPGDPARAAAPFYPVGGALAIITYPGAGEWTMPGPHIDHAIRADGHRVFPPPYRLASLLYLGDVARHGGGTVVWPRSHRTIEALARAASDRLDTMAALNESLASADLGEPLELTPRAGDILFYHYLLAHAGSKNTTDTPRIALNHKW
jgi:hypothetical protein